MRPNKLLLSFGILAVLVMLGLWLRNEIRIDRCLDHGGRWNAGQQACEGAVE